MTQPVDSPSRPSLESDLAGRPSDNSGAIARRSRFSGLAWRTAALLVAIVPIGLLGVASQLQPNTSGLGTHQQLGLPPCSMRVIFAIRCPSCGMTTSWAYFVRGQWTESAQVNVGGFLLALFSIPLVLLAIRCLSTGELPSLLAQQVVTVTALSIMAVTLVDWILRIT